MCLQLWGLSDMYLWSPAAQWLVEKAQLSSGIFIEITWNCTFTLEVYMPDPKVGFVRVSVWLCRVGSGSGSDFNFRIEIGFKVIVFKFSFGNKLCNKLSECWYLCYTFAFCSFKINSDTLLSVFDFTVHVNFFYSRYNSVILRLQSSNYKMDAFFG